MFIVLSNFCDSSVSSYFRQRAVQMEMCFLIHGYNEILSYTFW